MKNIHILMVVALLPLSACQSTMPRYEAEFGDSIRSSLNSQVINPEAGNNSDPVAGIDGRAARDAIHNYQKSFSKPTPEPSVFSIGVGNSNSGGDN